MSLLAEFLEQDQAAAELKVCQRTLDRWRRLGDGPPITKIGRRPFSTMRLLSRQMIKKYERRSSISYTGAS
jgi:hypothetical protein